MAVFISYSHQDKDFVDKLAEALVRNRAHVWLDRWEITVGQSLLAKVQDAIEGASALLVVLSESSTQSEWCKRELNAALMRELEERRVLVLPLRIDNCKAPPFLSDKLYADFRSDFEAGLQDVLNGIASVTAENLGRTQSGPGFYSDWSVEWSLDGPGFRILLVEPKQDEPCTIVSQVTVEGNEGAAAVREDYEREGLGWWWRRLTLELVAQSVERPDVKIHVVVEDERAQIFDMGFGDPKRDIIYRLHAEVRRVGSDNGHSVFVNLGSQIAMVCRTSVERVRMPTKEEILRISHLLQRRHGSA